MLPVVLAAVAGLSYGAADYAGAVASKDTNAGLVTLAMQVVSLFCLGPALWFLRPDVVQLSDFAFGALGGVAAAIALVSLYRALAIGPMSTAAGITGLVGAAIPVVVGLLLGDRPGALALVGVAASVPAVVLLSATSNPLRRRVFSGRTPREQVALAERANRTRVLAVVAGAGFGLFFVALSRTDPDSGLFPLVGARAASIPFLAGALSVQRAWKPIARSVWPTVVLAGVLDLAANAFYLLALVDGVFTWVAAIVSLYPVSTVLLARFLLKERLVPTQVIGLIMAGSALVLVAVGR